MTTENNIVTETVAEPFIDQDAADAAREQAEHQKMLAEMETRRAEEAAIAAEQDAAIAAVRAACDAERAALRQLEEAADAE
jgi:hypothetical protein